MLYQIIAASLFALAYAAPSSAATDLQKVKHWNLPAAGPSQQLQKRDPRRRRLRNLLLHAVPQHWKKKSLVSTKKSLDSKLESIHHPIFAADAFKSLIQKMEDPSLESSRREFPRYFISDLIEIEPLVRKIYFPSLQLCEL